MSNVYIKGAALAVIAAVVAVAGCEAHAGSCKPEGCHEGGQEQPGDTGAQGPKGDTGPAGPQGIPGRDGIDGLNGRDGFTPDISGLATRIDLRSISREMHRATAAALATAAVPQAFTPGAGMVGTGLGVWKGATAFAIGASTAVDDVFVAKGSLSLTTSGDAGGSVGLGFQF